MARHQVTQGAAATWRLNCRSALTTPYFLVAMTSQQTCLTVYFIAQSTSATGERAVLSLTEVGGGTVSAVDGEIALSPAGDWDAVVYDQASSSNLDPANANSELDRFVVRVNGDVCSPSSWTGGSGGGACAPATYTLRDEDGTTISSGSIASGASANIVAPDVDVVDQDANVIATPPSGGTYTVTLADAIVDPLTAAADAIVDPL